jgi:hypothetical protein
LVTWSGESGAQLAVGHQLQVDQVNTLTLGVLELGKLVPSLAVGLQLQVDQVNTLTLGVLELGKLVPSLL